MLLFSVLVCGTLMLHCTEVESKLCAYHLKGSGILTHPGSPKSKLLPKKYRPAPNSEFCIAYGSITWTQDIEFRMISRTEENVEIHIKPQEDRLLKTPIIASSSFEIDYMPYILYSPKSFLVNSTILLGNETAQFTMIFPKESIISIAYLRYRKQRKFFCPSLEPHFDAISCTNGQTKNSECTFRCKKNYAPSPLLYHNVTVLDIDKLGKSLPNISSVCSKSNTGAPMWSPDVIGWRAQYMWQSDLHTPCMSYQEILAVCDSYRFSEDFNPCRFYPVDLLLDIYDQNTDEVYVKPPTTTPPPSISDVDPDEFGLKNLHEVELQSILIELENWHNYCLRHLRNIIQSFSKSIDDQDAIPFRDRKIAAILQKLKKSFEMQCTTMQCVIPAHPCDDYCKTDRDGYTPKKCGAFKRGASSCMRCRFFSANGCFHRSFAVSC